jgi:hypothetical protein
MGPTGSTRFRPASRTALLTWLFVAASMVSSVPVAWADAVYCLKNNPPNSGTRAQCLCSVDSYRFKDFCTCGVRAGHGWSTYQGRCVPLAQANIKRRTSSSQTASANSSNKGTANRPSPKRNFKGSNGSGRSTSKHLAYDPSRDTCTQWKKNNGPCIAWHPTQQAAATSPVPQQRPVAPSSPNAAGAMPHPAPKPIALGSQPSATSNSSNANTQNNAPLARNAVSDSQVAADCGDSFLGQPNCPSPGPGTRDSSSRVGNARRRGTGSAVSAWARAARSAREHIHNTVVQCRAFSCFAGAWL